jgi:hypothetical protein
MGRRSGGGQRQRSEVAHQRDEQQESGDQSMHAEPEMQADYQHTDALSKNGVVRAVNPHVKNVPKQIE